MALARRDVAALAGVAFLLGASLPGLLARLPAAGGDAWLPAPERCASRDVLRLCTDRDAYARGATVDAALENLGDAPMAGRLRAYARDAHGEVVEQLAEADLILAPHVRLHLDWQPRGAQGEALAPGEYAVGTWFAGQLLERAVAIGVGQATRL